MGGKGLLTVFCGPSGVGKGSVLKAAMAKNSGIKLSVSVTTRKPRPGEVDGKDYFFVTIEEFKKMIESDQLAEWAEYCGNYYGTPRKAIEDDLMKGHDVILEIDTAGAKSIKSKYPDAVTIFLLPPSFDELKRRIVKRGTEELSVIEKRFETARMEIGLIEMYDYVIINDDIEKAASQLISILEAEKLKISRNKDMLKRMGF